MSMSDIRTLFAFAALMARSPIEHARMRDMLVAAMYDIEMNSR
jgi:hypothetical protein